LAAAGTHTAGADPKAAALAQLRFAAGVARELGDQVGYRLAEQARGTGATVAEISEAVLDQHGTPSGSKPIASPRLKGQRPGGGRGAGSEMVRMVPLYVNGLPAAVAMVGAALCSVLGRSRSAVTARCAFCHGRAV
jgi:hypothetical protein